MRTYTFFRVVKNSYMTENGLALAPTESNQIKFCDTEEKFSFLPSGSNLLLDLQDLGSIRLLFRLPCRLVETVLTVHDYWLEWRNAVKPSRTHMALLIAASIITLCVMLTGIIAPIVYFCR